MARNSFQDTTHLAMRQPQKEFTKSDSVTNENKINGTKTPTPLDFDRFIPWILLEMQSSATVLVTKVNQVENVPTERLRSKEIKVDIMDSQTFSNDSFKDENAIQIVTYYDKHGHLTGISFIKHPVMPVHRQILKAIALCLPFHPVLTKISFKRGKLHCGIIYEISKLLPFSKLTDVCLDHCHVPQGNFYILLDQQTTINCLSLSDCNIDDRVCQEIAERIEDFGPASKNLRVLTLSSNQITDAGAESLGHSLRTNRHLVYLNLCNNRITSVGAAHILLPLSKFSFFCDEILQYKDKRLHYIKKKLENAERILKDIPVNGNVEDGDGRRKHRELKSTKSVLNQRKRRPSKEQVMNSSGRSALETINEIALDVADRNDAFHPSNVSRKGGSWFSIGNFVLCCLNLAYNNLDYWSLRKLVAVLAYQQRHKTDQQRGLLRVVIEGNELPVWCCEYDLMDTYLKQNLTSMAPPSAMKKPGALAQTKERRRSGTKVKSTEV